MAAGNFSDELLIFEEFIETLKKAGCPIVVEGKRDVIALKKFNINNVHQLTSSIEDEANKIANSSRCVIILTDLDESGWELYHKLLSAFNRRGVAVNNKPRELLMKTKLRQVEGLYSRVMKLKN